MVYFLEVFYNERYMDNYMQLAGKEITEFLTEPNAYRSILILVVAIIVAYLASRFLAKLIIFIAQKVAVSSDSASDEAKAIKLRQVETYLSVAVAIVRAAVVAITAYIVWRLLSPKYASSGAAAIGASAFFIVFAGQTLGMILRDITAGVIMITEQWFHVGDFIKVEPFIDVSGVVERFTLRSTRLRSLSGEVIWIHNQQIQAAHVTPRGVRTLSADLFTRDREQAEKALQTLIDVLSANASLLSKPLKIKSIDKWGDDVWHIVLSGQTAPGREWMIEKFFVNAVQEIDEDKKKADRIFIYEPIVRYADPVAERRFRRAIREQRES